MNGAGTAANGGASGAGLESTARMDRDELVRGWREYAAAQPRVAPVLKFAAKTDMGRVRENNEDKFDFYEPEDPAILAARGSLFAVADGIGGALAGQIASEMLLKRLIAGYYDSPAAEPEAAIRDAVTDANDRIFHLAQMIPERSGMGTTLTAACFIEDRVLIVQLGDSRAYLLRYGAIRQVTLDHSWVEEQVRSGVLTRQDAEASPYRNVITRSVGAAPTAEPDFYYESAIPGDIWVLCTDGLTGHVEDAEIAHIAATQAPAEAARQLIELANGRGGRDNITVFVVAVRNVVPPDAHPARPAPVATSDTRAARRAVDDPAPGVAQRSEAPDLIPGRNGAAEAAQERGAVEPVAIEQARAEGQAIERAGWRRLFGAR